MARHFSADLNILGLIFYATADVFFFGEIINIPSGLYMGGSSW
jgi:hypothetical protein